MVPFPSSLLSLFESAHEISEMTTGKGEMEARIFYRVS